MITATINKNIGPHEKNLSKTLESQIRSNYNVDKVKDSQSQTDLLDRRKYGNKY